MQALAASCEELRARTGNPPLDGNPSSNDCVKSASQGKWKMNTTLPIRVKLTSTKVYLDYTVYIYTYCVFRLLSGSQVCNACKQTVCLHFELLYFLKYDVLSEYLLPFWFAMLLNEYEIEFMFRKIRNIRNLGNVYIKA